MNLSDILLVLLFASAGICGQKIELEVPQSSKSCEKGFRANTDAYYITGTIGPRFNELVSSGWISTLYFEVSPVGATNYTYICDAAFYSTGITCSAQSNNLCYCDQFDNSTSAAHVLAKYVAQVSHSLGSVRGRLANNNGSSIYSSTINKTLPEIFDVKDAVLTLTVNGAPADTTLGSCGLSFRANEENTVKLCCSKAAMPCNPRLVFNGIEVAKGLSPCVNYTFTANETVNVEKLYSVCGSPEYTSGFCLIQTSNEQPHNTTVPDKSDNKDLTLIVCLSVLIPAAFIGVIGGTVLVIWKKHKKNPAAEGQHSAENQGTTKPAGENIGLKKTGNGNTPSNGTQNKDQDGTDKKAETIGHDDKPNTSG